MSMMKCLADAAPANLKTLQNNYRQKRVLI